MAEKRSPVSPCHSWHWLTKSPGEQSEKGAHPRPAPLRSPFCALAQLHRVGLLWWPGKWHRLPKVFEK